MSLRNVTLSLICWLAVLSLSYAQSSILMENRIWVPESLNADFDFPFSEEEQSTGPYRLVVIGKRVTTKN